MLACAVLRQACFNKQILERESKWEVGDEFVLPALGEMAAGSTDVTVELNSQYYDTADRDLQAHQLLLRRRDGDDDADSLPGGSSRHCRRREPGRRLRSTLNVFGKLLNADAVGDIDTELKWFAGLFGEVRDCQVQRKRFHTALAELPPELVLGPVVGRIDSDLTSTQVRAREIVAEAMNSPRYLDQLATLQRWRTDLPVTGQLAAKALRKRAARSESKADRRLLAAIGTSVDADLHRARKAAKRARYAAELIGPLDDGGEAKRTMKRYKKIQTVLGDHQDGIVAAATLRCLGALAGAAPGENGFTFGLLYANQQHAAHGHGLWQPP